MRRFVLFGLSISSLLLLTYAGVLLAFSIEVTDDVVAANPGVPSGSRAVVVPLGDPTEIATLLDGTKADLLVQGETDGGFPTGATNVRIGRALAFVPEGSNGTLAVPNANVTLDLGALSGGAEGWILRGDGETDPWFSPTGRTLGRIETYETPGKLGALFALGALGFVAPLVYIIVTHKGARRGAAEGAPRPGVAICRECRAPMTPDATFCMRCGAYTQGGEPANA